MIRNRGAYKGRKQALNENEKNELRVLAASRATNTALAKQVRLRSSTFDGIFEVANVQEPFSTHRGESRIEVKVGWFGARPQTSWAHLTLGNEWELLSHYTGDVVHNVS